MAYLLTPTDLASITDVEMAFSTDRLLPAWDDIPDSFRQGNLYTQLAEAIFFGPPLPEMEMVFLEGFSYAMAAANLNRCVRAHLQSFSPKHQHKIAGVGYMISQVCALHSTESSQ